MFLHFKNHSGVIQFVVSCHDIFFAGFFLLQCSKSIFTYQEDLKDPGDLIF